MLLPGTVLDTSDTVMIIFQHSLCPNAIHNLEEKATPQYNELIMVIVIQCPVKEVITEREDEYVGFSEVFILYFILYIL